MMMKKTVRCISVLAMTVLLGCDGGDSEKTIVSKGEKRPDLSSITNQVTYFDLPSNAVLVAVGTNSFSKGAFCRLVDLKVKTVELSIPPGQKRNVNRMAIEAPMLSTVTNAYIAQTLLCEFASTNGIRVSEEDLTRARNKFKNACKKSFQRWNSFLDGFSEGQRATVEDRVRVESVCSKVRAWYLERNPVTVTTQEVVNCQKRLENYHDRAMATNAVIWAHASNIWKKVVSGENFEMLANRYTEDDTDPEDGEWGDFLLSDFADEKPLYDAILRMQPGEITPPIEGDNGLMILKLVSIDDEDAHNESGVVNPLKVRYSFSRIFFRLPEFYERASFEKIMSTLKVLKENKSFGKFVDQLKSSTTITFPSGTAIFEQARRMAKMPMMLIQNQ